MKYNKSIKLEDKCKIDIEIGDFKQVDFYPQVKFKHWDNECNFSLRFTSDIKESSYNQSNDEIIWIGSNNILVRMYEKINLPISNEEGYEFEFELPSKPKSNIFEMTIQTKGLDFFYQGNLTQEEINIGVYRPENVIGSYAVYHNFKKNNEYKTGKAFHIYRPEAIDKDGNKTWCDLNIDTDKEILTITVPQKFLDGAVYPVIVDPTFGYTSIGGTYANMGLTQCYAHPISATSSVSIDKLTVYTRKSNASTPNPFVKGIIFSGTSGVCPVITNGVAPAVEITGTSASWVDLPYSTKPSITNGSRYRLGWISNQDFPSTVAYYDFGPPAIDDSYNYEIPDSFSASFGEKPDARLSIYATYSTSPEPEPSDSSGSFDCWWSSQFKDSYRLLSISGSSVAVMNSKDDNKPFRLLSRSGTSLSGDFVIETSVYRRGTASNIQGISIFATSADVNNFGTYDSTSGCIMRIGVRNNNNSISGSTNNSSLSLVYSPLSASIIGLKFERRDDSISAFCKNGDLNWESINLTGTYSDNVYVVVEGNGYEGFDYFRIAAENGLPNNFFFATSSVSGTEYAVVTSASSKIIGSTIYLSAENVSAWKDNFNENDYKMI